VLKVGLIGEMQHMILEWLTPRVWSLARADPQSGGFICSDTPLTWSSAEPWDIGPAEERLDNPNVVITCPISKSLALITRDDGRQGTYQAVEMVVAWVNARTHLLSLGTLYSASEDFLLLRSGGRIGCSTDYFAHVERMRHAGVLNP
jgi:hypothetical protein